MFPLVGVILNVGIQFLPYAPLLLLFWIVDAGITSVATGSFSPIGVCVATIWSVMSQLVNAIVSIAQTIYDFIHFW